MSGICKPLYNTPLNRDHWASQNLVASYLFNENGGPTVHDSSGNENHGTKIGFGEDTPTSGWVPGPRGGALAFNGSNNFIKIASFDQRSTEMTIISWVNSLNYNVNKTIVSKAEVNSNATLFVYMNTIWLRGGGLDGLSRIPAPTIGISHQIAGTLKDTVGVIYIDGIGSPTVVTAIPNVPNVLRIGNYQDGGGTTGFLGLIGCIMIYNRALSAEEVAYLYAFPYCMYDTDPFPGLATLPGPKAQQYYRRLMAGGI
jgi:hypothetical protein